MASDRVLDKEKVRVYADVLLDSALGEGERAALDVAEQLDGCLRAFRSNYELREFVDDPTAAPERKAALVADALAGCDPTVVAGLSTMAARGDLHLLERVAARFVEELERRENVVIVGVTTAVALDDALRAKISAKVSEEFSARAVLREKLDPAVIGGIIISARGKRIDASLASMFERVRRDLEQVQEVNARD